MVFHDYLDLQELTDSQRDNCRLFQIEYTKGLTMQEESRKLPPKNDAKEICEHNIWNNNPWLQNLNIWFKHSSLPVYDAVTTISKLPTFRRRLMSQRSETMQSKTTHRLHRPWRRTQQHYQKQTRTCTSQGITSQNKNSTPLREPRLSTYVHVLFVEYISSGPGTTTR